MSEATQELPAIKAGDKVYGIAKYTQNLEVHYTTVEKVTDKLVWLEDRGSSAFGYAVRIERADVNRTPEEALGKYVERLVSEAANLRQQLIRAENKLTDVETVIHAKAYAVKASR